MSVQDFINNHLLSKTNGGLLLLLVVVVGLAMVGKLTSEAVEAIKWLGASFMAVRAAANASENMAPKSSEEKKE